MLVTAADGEFIMTYTSTLPSILQTGAGASEQIPQILASLGCQRPLIITDRMMAQLGYAERIRSALAEAGLPCDAFADTVPEPTVASIQSGVATAREAGTTASSRSVAVARSTATRPSASWPSTAARCATTNSRAT